MQCFTRVLHIFALLGVFVIAVGCNESKPAIANKTVKSPSKRVFAVSYPLQFLTQKIAGNEIEVLVPFTSNDHPCSFRPPREMISQMQAADLIIANGTGATYAKWLDTVSLPDSKVVNTASRGLALKEYIAVENASIVHSHGPEGEHSHPVMASRTWLDPALAKKQAAYIEKQLAKIYPGQAGKFAANLKSLTEELDRLTEKLQNAKTLEAPIVMSMGSEFKFLSRAAGVTDQTVVGFEAENSTIPTLEILKQGLEKQLAKLDPKPGSVLIEESVSLEKELAKTIMSFGLSPVVLDPLDHQPASGDYLTAMERNIANLSTAIGSQ